jgi:hypothetical protein
MHDTAARRWREYDAADVVVMANGASVTGSSLSIFLRYLRQVYELLETAKTIQKRMSQWWSHLASGICLAAESFQVWDIMLDPSKKPRFDRIRMQITPIST